jgi:hypothetical protein
MKFRSHMLNYEQVIRPSITLIENGFPRRTPPLRLYFLNGMADTEEHQRRYMWSDEDRELVERFMISHPSFERPQGHFLEDGQHLPPWYIPAAPKIPVGADQCIFVIRTPQGGEVCGKPVALGPYCREHGLLAGWDEEEEGFSDGEGTGDEDVKAAI